MLCGEPLAMAEQVPHPLAPTIDHVIPLARGGWHAPDNVQAAHFLCNSRKSDRPQEVA
jgi:5-methylcytosine-specific restriction endonuclease McrA